MTDVTPPGPFLQQCNAILHKEPWSTLFHCFYWSIVLIAGTPLCVIVLIIQCVWNLIQLAVSPINKDRYHPNNNTDSKLAVVITGCDSGFGKELALAADHAGFIVFAGCLLEGSFEQFKLCNNVTPLRMDVTKQQQVDEATATVSSWLETGASPTESRVLHAIVNNAGIFAPIGNADWLDVTVYEKVMNVNYIGMIRTCQAFLPLLKKQALNKCHVGASRIINVCSISGKIAESPGIGAYSASKHACTVYSTNLRLSLRRFGIQVTALLPSCHGTNMTGTSADSVKELWNKISDETKLGYGEEHLEYYQRSVRFILSYALWRSEIVVDYMLAALTQKTVSAEVFIGTDARTSTAMLILLPSFWIEQIMQIVFPSPIPSGMRD